MVKKIKATYLPDTLAIHQYYLDIISCMPNVVYWLDINCNLKGCNKNFVNLLGLKHIKDFAGTPYEQMAKFTTWTAERIQAFRLDDMKALFSGEPVQNLAEAPVRSKNGEDIWFRATRVPLFDKDKHIVGLVVILSDLNENKKIEELLVVSSSQQASVKDPLKNRPYVLLVEDNLVAQKVAEALLKALNCRVDVADSGDQAVQLFGPSKYDIVFMDIGLQDTSGYMVAKKFRQMEENTNHHVPIIALTSYKADVVKYDCDHYFMDGVLTKPLTREQAQQIIQHYIYHENIAVNGLKTAK